MSRTEYYCECCKCGAKIPRERTLCERCESSLAVRTGSGILEQTIKAIVRHDAEHPNHGVGCACMDEHSRALRRAMIDLGMTQPEMVKSRDNLQTVLHRLVCRL